MSGEWAGNRTRLAWWVFGGVLAVVLGFIVYSFVGTFVFGVFIYYATRPVYTRLKRRVRLPSIAAAISIFLLALPALLLLAYTTAIAFQEFNRLSNRYDLGFVQTYLQPYFDISGLLERPEQLLVGDGLNAVTEFLAEASTYLGFFGNAALHLFVMIAVAFYLLRDDHRLSRWVLRRFSDERGVLEIYLAAVDRSYHQIFFGNILNAALTATIGAIAYNALNLTAPGSGFIIPYPTLLGLLTGVASLIPIVGMKLVYVPTTAYLVGVSVLGDAPETMWFALVFFVVSFVIVDVIPDLVLRPYVSGRNLHVGMVMFAYILGPLLFGWYGIFLGPMLLVLIVHFARLVLPELIIGVPLQPAAIDPANIQLPEAAPTTDAADDTDDSISASDEPP